MKTLEGKEVRLPNLPISDEISRFRDKTVDVYPKEDVVEVAQDLKKELLKWLYSECSQELVEELLKKDVAHIKKLVNEAFCLGEQGDINNL